MQGVANKYRLAIAEMNMCSGILAGAGFREAHHEVVKHSVNDPLIVHAQRREFVLPDCEFSLRVAFRVMKEPAHIVYSVGEVKPNARSESGASEGINFIHESGSFGEKNYNQTEAYRGFYLCTAAKILGKAKLAFDMGPYVEKEEALIIFENEKISPYLTLVYSYLKNAGFILKDVHRTAPFVFENKEGQVVTIGRNQDGILSVNDFGPDAGTPKFPVDVRSFNLFRDMRTMLVNVQQALMEEERVERTGWSDGLKQHLENVCKAALAGANL